MKKILSIAASTVLSATLLAQPVRTPDQLFGELFKDVQLSHIFPDGKTFVDCTPKRDPAAILKDYRAVKNKPNIRFSLLRFVEENFDMPPSPPVLNYIQQEADVTVHIKNLWGVLGRNADKKIKGSSLLPLPNAYIVPGGRFREIYYWDSYFTMLGLKESGEASTIENMVKNFAYLINTYGHIPNGNRTYYIGRSQPPFFAAMVNLLATIKGDAIYTAFLPALQKEYNFWMNGAGMLKPGLAHRRVVMLKDGNILNRYWDDSDVPRQESYAEDVATAERSGRNKIEMYKHLRASAESGLDFSNRWFADGKSITTIETTNIIPVDLNCLLYTLELTIAKASAIQKNTKQAALFRDKADKRMKAINQFCWSSQLGYYTDYQFIKQKQTNAITPAGMYPFCFFENNSGELNASAGKAAQVLKEKLLRDGGIATTEFNAGQQWDAPNGWAPLQWMTTWGLDRCGQKDLAREIAVRWVKLNKDVYARTGKMMEKYNVVDTHLEAGGGEYPGQDGFGWTNGVLLALIRKYGL